MRPHPSADSRCVSAPPLGSRAVALAGCGAEPREEKFNYYVLHVACQNKYSCYAVQYSYYTSDAQDFSRRPTMFGTEEEANEHEEVRSMLDPELSAALELLDASGIEALLGEDFIEDQRTGAFAPRAHDVACSPERGAKGERALRD